jgi:hypothetical protein
VAEAPDAAWVAEEVEAPDAAWVAEEVKVPDAAQPVEAAGGLGAAWVAEGPYAEPQVEARGAAAWEAVVEAKS